MKWLVRSVVGLAIATCVALAILIGPLTDMLVTSALGRPSTGGREATVTASGRSGATDSLVADMHIRHRIERDEVVARIRQEFGIEVDPDGFSSHHTARDYLERLRLARQAKEMGFDVDPQAFGDDEFMRRHLESLLQGRASAVPGATEPAHGPAAPTTAVSPGDSIAATDAIAADRTDYVFIYGHRYYPDGHGAYVRADGTVLGLSTAKRPRVAVSEAASPDPPVSALMPGADLLGDLDEILGMLAPQSADAR
ncbi:MAG TPA: hypothetical protein VM243_04685 [Phycisphaerae bacterium]|nr:hypothetical protein [Phycisphaerae bacterium]